MVLAENPGALYDCERFNIPGTLGSPVPCSGLVASQVYQYLLDQQAEGTPLIFRTASEVAKNLSLIPEDVREAMNVIEFQEEVSYIGYNAWDITATYRYMVT